MKQLFKACTFALLGFILELVTIYIVLMNNRPDLEVWHTADLDAEFKVSNLIPSFTFEDYLKKEETLFYQLDQEVYREETAASPERFNRYIKGSWSDPRRQKTNWNKTFEISTPSPRAGILMLHGLSDSPYSMRSLADGFHRQNAWVVGLRLPGHGTAPVGLAHAHWQDFIAAVRLAARYVKEKIGEDAPLYLVGYSNGAALAIEYTFSQMLGEDLPKPAGLVLLSPAVAVSPMAFLARWNLLLAHLPGLEKLAWLSIAPEYDPFKYNSFAVNAGDQIYRLTQSNQT